MGYLPNCLETSEQNLVQQFGNIKNISEQLEQFVSNYILDETQLKTNIFDIKNKVNKLRDSISKCDDLSGESEKIIEKLTIFHQIQNDIAVCGTELTDSEKLLALLTSKYTCLREGGALPRELAAIKARYDKVVTNSATVKNNLTSYLKKMEMIKVAKLQTIITDCHSREKL
jgi:DNA repair exonuclease SbcCD ATPase subunit